MSEFVHKPVMLNECISGLKIKLDGIYVDGTLGGAGHSAEILKNIAAGGMLIGIDQDSEAIAAATDNLRRVPAKGTFKVIKTNFVNLKKACRECSVNEVDGILLDLGVSSHQFDTAERGFSYRFDAPLDMRMDRDTNEKTAEYIVNNYSVSELTRIIKNYGEEKWASRIAKKIDEARANAPIHTTSELVDIIKAAIPAAARREGGHPAKRTFQAIRIEVNDELGVLQKALNDAIDILAPDGRLCVITFHSLEDRIVKNIFQNAENPCTCPRDFPVCVCGKKPLGRMLTRKPITASESELKDNPRAECAKLRIFSKF